MVLHPGCFLVALLPTLHPIIVRRAATGLLIKVHVAGQPVKTLQRPAEDTLARTLDRVSRSFAARKKKGTHGKSELCFLFDARGVELDPSMSALQAWSGAARLRVGVMGGNGGGRGGGEELGSGGNGDEIGGETATLDVLFEPAEVMSLVLPAVVPFIGVPLTPSIETLGCDVRECRWMWERLRPGSAADGWQHVGSVSRRHSNMGLAPPAHAWNPSSADCLILRCLGRLILRSHRALSGTRVPAER